MREVDDGLLQGLTAMTKQSWIFSAGEGDAWYRRNRHIVDNELSPDAVVSAVRGLQFQRVLEIGCGGGERLEKIARRMDAVCFGVEPSAAAVFAANEKSGVSAMLGTADGLPFSRGTFDLVIFGFCLYLCDREDLFKIAAEADRVLQDGGHLAIYDFDNAPSKLAYKHRAGLFSYRMHYAEMFLWNPAYSLVKRVAAEDDAAVHILKKNLAAAYPEIAAPPTADARPALEDAQN